jgi:hypothetical protein
VAQLHAIAVDIALAGSLSLISGKVEAGIMKALEEQFG